MRYLSLKADDFKSVTLNGCCEFYKKKISELAYIEPDDTTNIPL